MVGGHSLIKKIMKVIFFQMYIVLFDVLYQSTISENRSCSTLDNLRLHGNQGSHVTDPKPV